MGPALPLPPVLVSEPAVALEPAHHPATHLSLRRSHRLGGRPDGVPACDGRPPGSYAIWTAASTEKPPLWSQRCISPPGLFSEPAASDEPAQAPGGEAGSTGSNPHGMRHFKT